MNKFRSLMYILRNGLSFLLLLGFLSRCRTKESVVISKCDLEPDSGFCNTVVETFFYNSTINECKKFDGCGGNENRFETKNDCRRSCMHPFVDQIESDLDDEKDEINDINKPSSKSLFVKYFQKSSLNGMDVLKPDVFTDDDEDKPNKHLKEGQTKEENKNEEKEEEETKKYPRIRFTNIFDFLHPKIKHIFDPFTRTLTGSLFRNFWSKKLNTFRKSFENVSKNLDNNSVPINIIKCYVCKKIVKMIRYEVNILKLSINHTLQTVQYICKFFPFAEKACEETLSDITIIIKSIREGQSPDDICEQLQQCRNSSLYNGVATQTVSITFSHNCAPLCNFIKVIHEEKRIQITKTLNTTKLELKRFCHDNKIIKKCHVFYRTIGKLFGHLSSITAKQNEEHCKCFKRQPLFDTTKFDSCLRCKQFEKGIVNELKQLNRSILSLASRVKGLCEGFPTNQACTNIVKVLTNSVGYNSVTMTNICNVTGYCEHAKTKNNFIDRIKESLSRLRGVFPNPYPFMAPHMEVNSRTSSPSCLFCKECMRDLNETFKNINETNVESKSVYPAVKEGFSMYCQTRSVDGDYTTVCRKISDGIETIHKEIAKNGNMEKMCKTLGVC